MKMKKAVPEAARHYAEAYEKHYSEENLYTALQSYKGVIVSYPDSEEAEYSRSQIQNILRHAVPGEELFEAHMKMALNYTKGNDVSRTPPVEETVRASAD